jgi:hypothetical protein
MFLERDLVRLVIQLHPYTQPPAPQPPSMIFGSPPAGNLTAPQANAIRAAVPAGGGPIANLDAALDAQIASNFPSFNFETQDNPAYQLAWTWHFKGQERIIRRALRFEYKYPVYNGGGALATDYVLIGYEGGGGP